MVWGVSYGEIAGCAAGAASVRLYVRQSVWAWPVGILDRARLATATARIDSLGKGAS